MYNKVFLIRYVWRIMKDSGVFIYKVYEVKCGFVEVNFIKGELKKGSGNSVGWRFRVYMFKC